MLIMQVVGSGTLLRHYAISEILDSPDEHIQHLFASRATSTTVTGFEPTSSPMLHSRLFLSHFASAPN